VSRLAARPIVAGHDPTLRPFAVNAIMEMTDHGREGPVARLAAAGMSKDEAANLAALHRNAIWRLAWKLSTPKSNGGGGLPANSAVSVALAEAERQAADGVRGWAQALADWRAWRFEP
jgi:hypothetical protein